MVMSSKYSDTHVTAEKEFSPVAPKSILVAAVFLVALVEIWYWTAGYWLEHPRGHPPLACFRLAR
jgi:hypothetical protein